MRKWPRRLGTLRHFSRKRTDHSRVGRGQDRRLSGDRKANGPDRRSSEIPGLGGARTRTGSKTERVISQIEI